MGKQQTKRRGAREGTIRKTDRGWLGAVALGHDNKGKQIRKWVLRQTRAEVATELQRLAQQKESGRPISSAKRTVGKFMLEWLEVHVKPNKAPLTYRGYEQTTRMYIIPMLGKIPLARLNGEDVQRCLNQASTDGLSPTSVKAINATLKTALTRAIRWKLLDHNAAKAATPPKQRKYHAKHLPAADADRLLKVVEGHRYEALIVVALMMGLRREEVAALHWSNIDFEQKILHVRYALQRHAGKGMVLAELKTEHSRRDLPIPSLCIEALLRRRTIQEEERIKAGAKWKQDSEFVFTSRDGHRIMIEEPIQILDEALQLAGLPHVRFHDLRHSTASLLIAKGVPLEFVSKIMGHSNLQITGDLYAHLLPTQVRDVMQTMNDIFEKLDVALDVAPTTRERIQ
jgi:integrase